MTDHDLDHVTRVLAAEPAPAMPADVFARLRRTIAAESEAREEGSRRAREVSDQAVTLKQGITPVRDALGDKTIEVREEVRRA